jgi:hypothetical protein
MAATPDGKLEKALRTSRDSETLMTDMTFLSTAAETPCDYESELFSECTFITAFGM